MVYRLAICDDSTPHNMELLKLVNAFAQKRHLKILIDIYNDGLDFVVAAEKIKYDIAFLDVEMPRMGGLAAAKIIRKKDLDMVFIYITNYPGFSFDTCEMEAIGYLVKPVDVEKLYRMMKRAFSIAHDVRKEHESKWIDITNQYETVPINTREIVYLEKYKNAIQIYMNDGKNYTWYQTIKEAVKLLDEREFVEVYRGVIVNVRYVEKIGEDEILLNCKNQKAKVPISKRKAPEIKKLYYQRLKHR